jgi:hypothetical protein
MIEMQYMCPRTSNPGFHANLVADEKFRRNESDKLSVALCTRSLDVPVVC